MTTNRRQCVECTDRGAGRIDLGIGVVAVTADRRDDFAGNRSIKAVLHRSGLVQGVALLEPRLAGDRVDAVDLESQVLDVLADRLDQMETLRLLGIAACRGEQEQRLPHDAVTDERDLTATESRRAPADLVLAHAYCSPSSFLPTWTA